MDGSPRPGHNRSLGERVHDAMVVAAEKKQDALRAKKRAERLFDIAFIAVKEAKNADERKARARLDPTFTAADDDATEAECKAIGAKAEADGLEIEWETWRSHQANARAEMSLR